MENPTKNTNNEMPTPNENNEGSIGPVIGSVIVVILIIIAGIYLVGSLREEIDNTDVPEFIPAEKDNDENSEEDLAEIEAELNADLNLEDINEDLEAIEQEFENI
jgi:hypothetical protein